MNTTKYPALVYEEIEAAIRAAFMKSVESENTGRPDLSKTLFATLSDLALAKNLRVKCRPSDRVPRTAEWLWDFVMYESDDPDGQRIGRIRLVLESEYESYPNKIREDLHKVIVARSEMRGFVFWSGPGDDRERLFDFIQREISESPNADAADTYLVAGLSGNEPPSSEFRYMRK